MRAVQSRAFAYESRFDLLQADSAEFNFAALFTSGPEPFLRRAPIAWNNLIFFVQDRPGFPELAGFSPVKIHA